MFAVILIAFYLLLAFNVQHDAARFFSSFDVRLPGEDVVVPCSDADPKARAEFEAMSFRGERETRRGETGAVSLLKLSSSIKNCRQELEVRSGMETFRGERKERGL